MFQPYRPNWRIPIFLIAVIAIVLWISPEERTLGTRIKSVYIHVAFTWVGLLGITLAGLLSLGVWVKPIAKRLEKILPVLNTTGSIFFIIGVVLSLIASHINWGSVVWTEPRMVAASRIIAMILIIQVLMLWVQDIRLRGMLYLGLLLFTVWTQSNVDDAIHPVNPIFSSDSNVFAITVLTLTALVAMVAVWGMTTWYRTQQ